MAHIGQNWEFAFEAACASARAASSCRLVAWSFCSASLRAVTSAYHMHPASPAVGIQVGDVMGPGVTDFAVWLDQGSRKNLLLAVQRGADIGFVLGEQFRAEHNVNWPKPWRALDDDHAALAPGRRWAREQIADTVLGESHVRNL